jgi:hypothetical protein
LQKPRDLTDCLPPPRTLILDFTLTHTRFGKLQLSSLGQLTHTRRTDGVPEPDGALRTVARAKIRHYRQLYINLPEPIAFMPVVVDTAGRIYEDFSRLSEDRKKCRMTFMDGVVRLLGFRVRVFRVKFIIQISI